MAREREVPLVVLMRYFRVPTDLAVDYPGREVLLGSRITNISTLGVFIRTAKPLMEGNELMVAFHLPNSEHELRSQAVVRWRSSGQGEGSRAAPGMGLEFINMNRTDKKLIEHFVREFLRRMRKK